MLSQKERLQQIINLGFEISQFRDLDVLLEKILATARTFTGAEAGSIYIKENNRLKFSYTQNEALQKRLAPGRKLIYSTFTIPINCDSIAGHVASTEEILNIPDVYTIGSNTPYCFDSHYDELSNYRTRSMITLPLTTGKRGVIGILQLINARNHTGKIVSFKRTDEPYIQYFANTAAVAIERAHLTRDIILRTTRMAELRDPKETGAHVNRVASYAVEIYEAWGHRMGISQHDLEKGRDVLRLGAMLHDVGKVGISDTILKKPARLTPEEYDIMKQHTCLGASLFTDKHSEFDEAASIIALNHHEWWNGRGYPGHVNPVTGRPIPGYETSDGRARGKAGEEIPPFGRVVAIADVYDALCSKRAYKEPWEESKVLDELRNEAGGQFDPEMIESFFSILDVIRNITERYPE